MSAGDPGEASRWIAFTRAVGPRLVECELTHLARAPIDVERAAAQHEAYEAALRGLGCQVVRLPDLPDHPDGVFVEDVAVVLDGVAVVTRPGAASRRGEVVGMAEMLRPHRPVRCIEEPARLDGGDVLVAGKRVFVGASARTDLEGARQLAAILEPLGYQVRRVTVRGCLHLKTAVTAVADGVLVLNPAWVERGAFPGFDTIPVAEREPLAANVLRIGDAVLVPAAHPRTAERIAAAGVSNQVALDVSELAKAEAGVTCCSLVLRTEVPE